MWSLMITSPKNEPVQIKLVPGKMQIGRLNTCDIVIDDPIASRRHADIYYDPLPELVTIKDLNSVNGTYVNRRMITDLIRLQDGDQIRIGQTVMHLARIPDRPGAQKNVTSTQIFSRDLVLEAVDEHPILLNEIGEKLNTVVSLDTAIHQIVELVTKAMGVDLCELILASDFANIDPADGPITRAIQNSSIESAPLTLYLPVMNDGQPLALMHLERTRPGARPFDKRDIQLAVAISHQAALTMQRIKRIDAIGEHDQRNRNLMRLLLPVEVEELLKDYLKTGILPEPSEKKVAVMYAEMTATSGSAGESLPEPMASLLKAFFQNSTQAVIKKKGLVKFLGNGILAIFLEIEAAPAPEERAIDAAQEIIHFIKHDALFEIGQPGVVGIAVNAGTAMTGYMSIGEWVEFNVLGDLIKITCQMQAQAFPNRILAGAATADAIRSKFPVQEAGSLALQCAQQPVRVFDVGLKKITPLVQDEKEKDASLSDAFRSVAEKFRMRAKKEPPDGEA